MVAHRSQKVSSQEQSSGWSTMLHSTATRIALLILLLGSWLPKLSIRRNAPLHKKFSTETWKKDPFPSRNHLINGFNIDDINNSYLQVNRYIDDSNKHKLNVTRYKVTSPTRNRPQVRHGLRIIIPRRRSAKRNGKEVEEVKRERMVEWPDSSVDRERDFAEQANQDSIEKASSEIGGMKTRAPDKADEESDRIPTRPPLDQNSIGETHVKLGKVEEESPDDTNKHPTIVLSKKELYEQSTRSLYETA